MIACTSAFGNYVVVSCDVATAVLSHAIQCQLHPIIIKQLICYFARGLAQAIIVVAFSFEMMIMHAN